MRTADEIRAILRQINPEWAKGAAMFAEAGVNGLTMWDCQRKINLSLIEMEARTQAEKTGVKLTDKGMDAISHSAESYQNFIAHATVARCGWLEMNAERELLLMELRTAESHESFGATL